MSGRGYQKLLAAVIAVCLLLTLLHVGYAVYAYRHSSVIQFIGREWW